MIAINNSHFFCGLGFPKTGTTWLAHYLRDHPNVYVPLIKELHVFSRRFRPDIYSWIDQTFNDNLVRTSDKLISGGGNQGKLAELTGLLAEVLALPYHSEKAYMMKAYRRLFRGRINPDHLAFGEFSTTYCLLPQEGLRILDSAFPETRYILILRDPVQRFWSHVKHQTRLREDFDPLTQYSEMFDDPELAQMSDYRTVVNSIRGVIPSERLHFALYEDLFMRHDETALNAITDFLALPFVPADFNAVVYGGESLPMPDAFRAEAMQRFQDSYLFATELYGELPEGWVSKLD